MMDDRRRSNNRRNSPTSASLCHVSMWGGRVRSIDLSFGLEEAAAAACFCCQPQLGRPERHPTQASSVARCSRPPGAVSVSLTRGSKIEGFKAHSVDAHQRPEVTCIGGIGLRTSLCGPSVHRIDRRLRLIGPTPVERWSGPNEYVTVCGLRHLRTLVDPTPTPSTRSTD